jgi:hypothetical protein
MIAVGPGTRRTASGSFKRLEKQAKYSVTVGRSGQTDAISSITVSLSHGRLPVWTSLWCWFILALVMPTRCWSIFRTTRLGNMACSNACPKGAAGNHARKGAGGLREGVAQFLKAMDLLGEKLGLLLFQFGYFNRRAFRSRFLVTFISSSVEMHCRRSFRACTVKNDCAT